MGLRLLIADPRDPFRQGLSAIFTKCSGVTEVVEAATEAELHYQLQAQTYDLVVVSQLLVTDITFLPRNHFLLLTSKLDMRMLFAARQYGARGYLLENVSDTVLRQILELPQGAFLTDPPASAWLVDYFAHHSIISISDEALTVREREVFHLLWRGCSRQEIARQLNITEQTVRVHANHIHEKMRLSRRGVLHVLEPSRQSICCCKPGITRLYLSLAAQILNSIVYTRLSTSPSCLF